MLNNIMIGSYFPVKSKIHFMNPVVKLLCTVVFIVLAFICRNIKLLLLISFVAVLMVEMSHLPRRIYIKTFKSLRVLILFVAVIYYFIGSDLESILSMILKLYIIVLYSTVLTLTTPPNDIAYALEKVMSPLKLLFIPVNKIAMSISLALRFIPTILEQGSKILKSEASRGVDYYNSNISGKIVAIKSMIIPMFILTVRRADNLAEAMQVRLFNINKKRTNFRVRRIDFFDIFMMLIHFGILALILYKDGTLYELYKIFNKIFL